MKQWITPLALGHAIAMILYGLQYQSFKQHTQNLQKLQQHVDKLGQLVALTKKQLTYVQSPDYIASYARNTLGMQPINHSQIRHISVTPTTDG